MIMRFEDSQTGISHPLMGPRCETVFFIVSNPIQPKIGTPVFFQKAPFPNKRSHQGAKVRDPSGSSMTGSNSNALRDRKVSCSKKMVDDRVLKRPFGPVLNDICSSSTDSKYVHSPPRTHTHGYRNTRKWSGPFWMTRIPNTFDRSVLN